ncbi:MAG TPA: DUF2505 domain-containing protein [Jatrophihabitans sp.]|nr:DUF2505 domain-containing protein [Jatrophihabitans sp.]
MKLTVENQYSATPEQTFASHMASEAREQACQESGAISWDVSITPAADGGAGVTVERVMKPQLPDYIQKFVGDSISIRQVEQWSAPAADGSRTGTVRLTIKGQPASMDGTMSLRPGPQGTVEVVQGDVRVAIPLLGRKIEPEIVKVIEGALRIEQRVGQEWITAHS